MAVGMPVSVAKKSSMAADRSRADQHSSMAAASSCARSKSTADGSPPPGRAEAVGTKRPSGFCVGAAVPLAGAAEHGLRGRRGERSETRVGADQRDRRRDTTMGPDKNRRSAAQLLLALKQRLPELERLLEKVSDHWGEEDGDAFDVEITDYH